MVDGAKSLIPSQWASEVSSEQHFAEHCHEVKLRPFKKVNSSILFSCSCFGAYNLHIHD